MGFEYNKYQLAAGHGSAVDTSRIDFYAKLNMVNTFGSASLVLVARPILTGNVNETYKLELFFFGDFMPLLIYI